LGTDNNGSNGWSLAVDISGLAPGTYTYSAVARDDDGAESQPVQTTNTVAPTQTGSAFEEVDGVVTIEAADASRRTTAGNGVAWVDVADSAAVGGTLVQALPDIDSNTGTALTGPKLDYDINFQNSGVYYVWVRMTGDGGANDSVHVGLNGQAETLDGQFGFYSNNRNVLEWTDGTTPLGRRLTVNVPSAGVHTLNIWAREDGVKVDEIRVARSVDFDPRVTTPPPPPPNQAPTIGALTDSPDPAPIDSEILIQATGVNDVDGTVPLVRFFREVVGGEDVLLFTDRNPSNGFAGFISVAELAPGSTTTYYAIAEDNDGAQSIRAITTNTVLNSAGGPVYQETAGLVTIEASRPSALVQNTGLPSWDVFNQPGASGESPNVLQAFGEGSNFGNTTDGPRADYDITFTNPGTYFVWVRMNGPTGSDDSIHVGLNNEIQTLGAFGVYPGAKNTFEWVNDVPGLGRITVDVPEPGISTLNIWMREDGVIVDEIRLSSDPNFNPAVTPPPATNTAPTVASLTASPNPIVVGDNVTLTANGVFDSDGTIASVTFGYEDGTFGDQVIGTDTDGSDGYTFTDNTFDIGAGRTYYVFATDDDGAFSNRVEVRLNTISEPTDAFQEVDGLVTIEATDATARASAQGREWVDDTRPDAINGTFVTAPGEGVNTGGQADGPRLDYDIEFANSGTYYVWLRMTAEDFGSDSVHVGLNGQSVTTNTFGVSGGGDDVFTWTDGSNSINRRLTVNVPAAGVQTLNVWMREDGVKVDEIRVARSESYDPRTVAAGLRLDDSFGAGGKADLRLDPGTPFGKIFDVFVSETVGGPTWALGYAFYDHYPTAPTEVDGGSNTIARPDFSEGVAGAVRIDENGTVVQRYIPLEETAITFAGHTRDVRPAPGGGFFGLRERESIYTIAKFNDDLQLDSSFAPVVVDQRNTPWTSFWYDVAPDGSVVIGQSNDGVIDTAVELKVDTFDASGDLRASRIVTPDDLGFERNGLANEGDYIFSFGGVGGLASGSVALAYRALNFVPVISEAVIGTVRLTADLEVDTSFADAGISSGVVDQISFISDFKSDSTGRAVIVLDEDDAASSVHVQDADGRFVHSEQLQSLPWNAATSPAAIEIDISDEHFAVLYQRDRGSDFFDNIYGDFLFEQGTLEQPEADLIAEDYVLLYGNFTDFVARYELGEGAGTSFGGGAAAFATDGSLFVGGVKEEYEIDDEFVVSDVEASANVLKLLVTTPGTET
ncbi:MAG: hypothetical protein AAGI46_14630, partial [Planctomycetota bacterium]